MPQDKAQNGENGDGDGEDGGEQVICQRRRQVHYPVIIEFREKCDDGLSLFPNPLRIFLSSLDDSWLPLRTGWCLCVVCSGCHRYTSSHYYNRYSEPSSSSFQSRLIAVSRFTLTRYGL